MAKEIERKFIVTDAEAVRVSARRAVHISQGYLSVDPLRTVRVRVRDNRGFLTVKGINHGAERSEWEYEIAPADAREMLELAVGKIIEKTRYLVDFGGHLWEVDEFHSPVAIWVAEVELTDAAEEVILPPWVGEEVTGNPEYYNSNLTK